MSKKNIIILGSGFAAFSCLKKLNKTLYNISLVSPRNHFLFTPLLPSTTVGTVEFRSIIEPIRNIKNVNFYKSYCKTINSEKKSIFCVDPFDKQEYELFYDILIIAVGELTNSFNIEGVHEHSFYLREISDARKIRTKVIECFEHASLPEISLDEKKNFLRFVVCGGGPTGVEFAAELHDFIEEDVKKRYKKLAELTELILIEAGTKLLNSFDKKLSEYTMKIFKRQNIMVKINSSIIKITEDLIYVNNGSKFPYGLLVWATGNTATELVSESNFPKNSKNKIIVDKFLKIKGHEDSYALGDCSENESQIYPATGQVAQQEGYYLGKSLNKLAKQKNVKPFVFRNFGMLAYVGSKKALADIPQYKGTGFATFIFWRSVYLTKLVSLKNKILVLFDWFKNFVFGRDVSNF
jgi:NADH:ubiquinone reductase (non-electrogenic)